MKSIVSVVAAVSLLACLSSGVAGQAPTFTVSPDTGGQGTPRTITVTAPQTGSFSLPFNNCLQQTFHTGGPNGPTVPAFYPLCSPNPVQLAPCQSLSLPIDQFLLNGIGPGTYWLKCPYTPGGAAFPINAWVDIRVDAGNEPTLTAPQPQVGMPWNITVSHPSDPAAYYFAAASFTTDTGLPYPGGFISLDYDFLFQLSFPTPFPLLFQNFQGPLDAAGNATMTMLIPPVPPLSCLGLHVQAILISPPSTPVITNCLDETIQ